MKSILSSRLVQSLSNCFGTYASYLQHLLMKAAVVISLKLCWVTARILLKGSARRRAGSAL